MGWERGFRDPRLKLQNSSRPSQSRTRQHREDVAYYGRMNHFFYRAKRPTAPQGWNRITPAFPLSGMH